MVMTKEQLELMIESQNTWIEKAKSILKEAVEEMLDMKALLKEAKDEIINLRKQVDEMPGRKGTNKRVNSRRIMEDK
jgi:hypothetical protein